MKTYSSRSLARVLLLCSAFLLVGLAATTVLAQDQIDIGAHHSADDPIDIGATPLPGSTNIHQGDGVVCDGLGGCSSIPGADAGGGGGGIDPAQALQTGAGVVQTLNSLLKGGGGCGCPDRRYPPPGSKARPAEIKADLARCGGPSCVQIRLQMEKANPAAAPLQSLPGAMQGMQQALSAFQQVQGLLGQLGGGGGSGSGSPGSASTPSYYNGPTYDPNQALNDIYQNYSSVDGLDTSNIDSFFGPGSSNQQVNIDGLNPNSAFVNDAASGNNEPGLSPQNYFCEDEDCDNLSSASYNKPDSIAAQQLRSDGGITRNNDNQDTYNQASAAADAQSSDTYSGSGNVSSRSDVDYLDGNSDSPSIGNRLASNYTGQSNSAADAVLREARKNGVAVEDVEQLLNSIGIDDINDWSPDRFNQRRLENGEYVLIDTVTGEEYLLLPENNSYEAFSWEYEEDPDAWFEVFIEELSRRAIQLTPFPIMLFQLY